MQTNAPETQGVILGKSKIKSYKHDNAIEQSGNTTNTILLDVISESLQICDFTFLCGLVESHAHTSDLSEVFPLIVPASKPVVNKNNGDAGRNFHVGECC